MLHLLVFVSHCSFCRSYFYVFFSFSSFSLFFMSASPVRALVLQVCGCSGTFREACWKHHFLTQLFIYFTKRNALCIDQCIKRLQGTTPNLCSQFSSHTYILKHTHPTLYPAPIPHAIIFFNIHSIVVMKNILSRTN